MSDFLRFTETLESGSCNGVYKLRKDVRIVRIYNIKAIHGVVHNVQHPIRYE